MRKNLSEVKRRPVAELLGGLLNPNPGLSRQAADLLVSEAKDSGLSFQDYLRLAALPIDEKEPQKYAELNGFEASLAFLDLPFADHLDQGVFLQAASDTFQKYPGTRAMFPEVVDTILRWKNRQNSFESITPFLAQSRTINGAEMISTIVDDDSQERGTFAIAELGRIPVRTIRTSQTAVGIFKHGSGIRTSYEFERRVSLDVLTPFAARVARELELSKIRAAVATIVNGDTVNGAAPTVNFSTVGGTPVNGGASRLRTQYPALMTWLVRAASEGRPIDTIAGNLNMYMELLLMFTPTVAGVSEAEAVAAQGGPRINVNLPILGGNVNFAYASSLPDNRLLGFNRAETLEELIEAGSSISENEKSIQNQSIVYVRTENTGYKLAWGDTRQMLVLDA